MVGFNAWRERSAGLVNRLTFVLPCTCFIVVLVFLEGQIQFPHSVLLCFTQVLWAVLNKCENYGTLLCFLTKSITVSQ